MEEIARVVVMDDDPDARELIRASLEGEGYEVLLAADAATGLELVRRERPDLVLIDYLLPETDGLEVCRRIGADPGTSDLPRILLTGKEDLDPDAVRAAGAAGVVAKPFPPSRLGSRIRALLESRDGAGGSPETEHESTVREIRARFVRGLPDRLAILRRTLDRILSGTSDDDPVEELWREAHKLAGTASSFDLPGISDPARSLEELAEGWSRAEEVPDRDRAEARRQIGRLEERSRELLDRQNDTGPG